MFTTLTATSQTISIFLGNQLKSDLDNLGMVVTLNNPQEMTENNVQGLSVWLYRLERDEQLLNSPPERISSTQLKRASLPFRLHYLITPIVKKDEELSPETEQRFLGKVLQAFHDHPKLRGSDLQGDLDGTAVELSVRFEPMNLEEITRIWDALDRSYQLSVSYEVSVVYICSGKEPEDVSPVEIVLPEYGVIVSSEEP